MFMEYGATKLGKTKHYPRSNKLKLLIGYILKVDYLIICIICDTDSVNKLTLQKYTLHKYE